MIKKIKSKLAVKVFIISALLIAFCCGITYFFILHFAPYIYSYAPSDVEWLADELAQELSMTDKGETSIYFSIANNTLTGDYNNEYLFHLFNSAGEEVGLTDTDTATGKKISDYSPNDTSAHYTVSFIGETHSYTLLLAKNTDKESQVVEALHKALPALTIVIIMVSVLVAVFYAWYITAPIKKISKMSRRMANMDFNNFCPVERTDEIGVLANSLNSLSSNLSAALMELKEANQKLQADIDKEKELELRRMEFFSAASHELKTPISAIMMSLQLLEDKRIGNLNEEQEQLSKSIKENSERLLNITGELLNMTQVEAGKLQLMPKITKPIELINYAINANRVQAEKFGCQIEVEYPEKISKLFVDSEKIAWVITNLLSNAIRYSKENSRVIIGAKQENNIVEIYVQDFGKGIDPRYHKSIFDRYFRVPGTKVQGSGLGLSISKDFVEAHNGTLTVESELGKGSCFKILIPVWKKKDEK